MPATALEPICLDPLAWRRYERDIAAWRDRSDRSRVVEERLAELRAALAELEVEEHEFLAPDAFKPPTNPGDVWRCPSCDRRFPSHASTARHMEFEHGEVVAC